jgi:ABC-type transport system involved in multi-copper enzyme maturation permease subunit
MGLLLITRFTLLEAIRRRLFLAVLILSLLILGAFTLLLAVVINVSLASNNSGTDPQLLLLGGGIFVTVMAIWMVYLLSSTLTIVLTAGMISLEIEAGTFAIIVPKPLARAEIIFGKWLGYALIVTLYTAFMFLAFLVIIYWQTGYWPLNAFSALAMLNLCMLALLGLTTLGGTLVPTIVNGAIALMLFIGAPTASIVQFIVQFLRPTQSMLVQNITTVINLIIPTDALWHGASFYLLPSADVFAAVDVNPQNFNTPFTSAQPVAPALIIWVLFYCTILPVLAAWRFQHRDL